MRTLIGWHASRNGFRLVIIIANGIAFHRGDSGQHRSRTKVPGNPAQRADTPVRSVIGKSCTRFSQIAFPDIGMPLLKPFSCRKKRTSEVCSLISVILQIPGTKSINSSASYEPVESPTWLVLTMVPILSLSKESNYLLSHLYNA